MWQFKGAVSFLEELLEGLYVTEIVYTYVKREDIHFLLFFDLSDMVF